MGNVAKQTEALYYTEHYNVNAEATWMESGYTYPERSENNLAEIKANIKAETGDRIKNSIMVFSEVSRGHSKPETSHTKKKKSVEASQKDEGLNVRMVKRSESLGHRQQQPKHVRELP